jgi:hypothetical protein
MLLYFNKNHRVAGTVKGNDVDFKSPVFCYWLNIALDDRVSAATEKLRRDVFAPVTIGDAYVRSFMPR